MNKHTSFSCDHHVVDLSLHDLLHVPHFIIVYLSLFSLTIKMEGIVSWYIASIVKYCLYTYWSQRLLK